MTRFQVKSDFGFITYDIYSTISIVCFWIFQIISSSKTIKGSILYTRVFSLFINTITWFWFPWTLHVTQIQQKQRHLPEDWHLCKRYILSTFEIFALSDIIAIFYTLFYSLSKNKLGRQDVPFVVMGHIFLTIWMQNWNRCWEIFHQTKIIPLWNKIILLFFLKNRRNNLALNLMLLLMDRKKPHMYAY